MSALAELFSFACYALISLALIAGLLAAAWWLGAKCTSPNKQQPYESGVLPTGSARMALTVPFYLVAIFFIVFDVESAFIFTWAVVREQLGLAGLLHITFFIVALLLGLIWLALKGGLNWGPSKEQLSNDQT